MVGTGDRRTVVTYLVQNHQVSITRACRTSGFSKSQYYYQSKKDDSEVVDKLNALVENKPNRGFPYFFHRIRNEGYVWNHKKVKRVYKLMNLNKRRKHKRRLPARFREPLAQPNSINGTWSIDFMHDTLMNGRKVRILNIIDDFNREALTINADYSQSGRTVVSALEDLKYWRGRPIEIRLNFYPTTLLIIVKHKVFISSTSSPENPLRTLISSALIEAIAKMYWTLTCLNHCTISENYLQNGKMNTMNFILINL